MFELYFSQHQHAALENQDPGDPGCCVCVCLCVTQRERLQGLSPVSWSSLYVCHLLSTTPAWPTSAWPTRLYGSSGLFPLVSLCLICSLSHTLSLSLFPVWGPVLTSLLDRQNRTTKACKDVERPRWIRQKVLAHSQLLPRIRQDHPVHIHTHTHTAHIHTSARTHTHLGHRVKREERGTLSLHHGSSVFTGCRASETCANLYDLPSHIYLKLSYRWYIKLDM